MCLHREAFLDDDGLSTWYSITLYFIAYRKRDESKYHLYWSMLRHIITPEAPLRAALTVNSPDDDDANKISAKSVTRSDDHPSICACFNCGVTSYVIVNNNFCSKGISFSWTQWTEHPLIRSQIVQPLLLCGDIQPVHLLAILTAPSLLLSTRNVRES